MIDLTGKRAFVTGGGRGIGLATAHLLARAGAKVAVGYRSRKPEFDGAIAAAIAGDLGDPAAAKRAVDEAVRALGGKGLDILVVNHGIWPPIDVPLARMEEAQWEGTVRANLGGVFYVCRAAIPHLSEGGGGAARSCSCPPPPASAARRSTPIMPPRRARSFPSPSRSPWSWPRRSP